MWKNIRFFKKWSINNFIYWSPYVFLVIFLTSTFIVSWYSTVFLSYATEMIIFSLSSLILLASASAFVTSSSCNKSSSILVPIKIACRSLMTFFLSIFSRGFDIEWPVQFEFLLLSWKQNYLQDSKNVIFVFNTTSWINPLKFFHFLFWNFQSFQFRFSIFIFIFISSVFSCAYLLSFCIFRDGRL